jgi:hypothetical protein
MHHPHVIHIDELVSLEKDKYAIRTTTALEKVIPSLINAIFAFGVATPALIAWGPTLSWKFTVIIVFGLYEACMFLLFKDRCFGMKIMDTYHKHHFNARQHVLYNILYTLSFSTTLIYVWFPCDLLLFNIFCIQLPCVLLTGTTLHGYVSGIETVAIVAK